MVYKNNYKEVIARLNSLYTGKGHDRIYARMCIANPAVEQYAKVHSNGETAYPDLNERIQFWDEYLYCYSGLEDDSIPACYLSELDEGLYGGLVGGEQRFVNDNSNGWVSSMTVPFIKDLRETSGFELNRENPWFILYEKQLELYKKAAEGKFGISHFILINGLNFLFEIRGATDTYYDVLENPVLTGRVMEFSYKLNVWVQETFFNRIGLNDGGTCSNMAQWVPGRIVSESVDPFHLTSADMFEEWGRSPIEKVFAHFDGGIIHIHTNGYHLLSNVADIKGLKCIYMVDEDFGTQAYEKICELDSKRKSIPLSLSIPWDIFTTKLDKRELPPNILYNVSGVPDVEQANRLMQDVRGYRI